MWRSKKVIIVAVLAALVLVGSIAGVALAQTGDENDNQPVAPINTLWDKVATILQEDGVSVTSEQLQSAFSEAQEQLRTEALQKHLEELVAQGKITQEQADAYLKWMGDKPDISGGFGFFGRGGFRGMHGMRGFGGLCAPAE